MLEARRMMGCILHGNLPAVLLRTLLHILLLIHILVPQILPVLQILVLEPEAFGILLVLLLPALLEFLDYHDDGDGYDHGDAYHHGRGGCAREEGDESWSSFVAGR
ncbi:hypothetical protein C8J55DRAFT_527778 [Lentinula edodes]|uniref:Uncharacterized protein n=1 Tax=Lentinula lateritia TaxID=40482 RepID=A0A9W8ZSU5_9AGAR|nr:hypothetical protein C8J55DRAFT_527778 [Lentinula edodes]